MDIQVIAANQATETYQKAAEMAKIRQRRLKASTGNIHIEMIEADNPHFASAHAGASWNPKKITVAVNVRESSLVFMQARGLLDEAQVMAGKRLLRLWETLGGSGAQAIDYSKEPVDGGGAREPITLAQLDAGHKLDAAKEKLGERQYRLVCKIVCEGYSVTDLGQTHRQRTTYADYLKDGLDDLAELWNIYAVDSTRKRPNRSVASL